MNHILFGDDAIAISEFLAKNPRQINLLGVNGKTPLIVAAEKGLIDVIDVLLSFGADVNLQDYGGNSALHLATKNQNIDAMLRLISFGADGLLQNNNLDTPLHMAVSSYLSNLRDVVNILTPISNFNLVNNYGNTPLMEGVFIIREVDLILYLIEFTTNINQVNKRGKTALSIAVARGYSGDFPLIKSLIEKGADVNYVDKKDMSILNIAIFEECSKQLLKLLLEKVNEIDDYNVLLAIKTQRNYKFFNLLLSKIEKISDDYPILEEAIRHSLDDDIIFLLIEKGADVNAISYNNEPIILFAFLYDRSYDLFKVLINYGADINILDKKGNSLLQIINASAGFNRKFIRKSMMKILVKRGAKYFYNGREYKYRFYPDDSYLEPY